MGIVADVGSLVVMACLGAPESEALHVPVPPTLPPEPTTIDVSIVITPLSPPPDPTPPIRPVRVCVMTHVRGDIIDPFTAACSWTATQVKRDLVDPFEHDRGPAVPVPGTASPVEPSTVDPFFGVVDGESPFAPAIAHVLLDPGVLAHSLPRSPDLVDPFTVDSKDAPLPRDLRDPLADDASEPQPIPVPAVPAGTCSPAMIDGVPVQRPKTLDVPQCSEPTIGGAAEQRRSSARPIVAVRSGGLARE